MRIQPLKSRCFPLSSDLVRLVERLDDAIVMAAHDPTEHARASFLLGASRGKPMFEAIFAFFVILSVGILVAHGFDAFRS